jgi:hypothetical protein
MLNWPPGGDRLWLVTRSDGGSTVDRRFGLEDEVLAVIQRSEAAAARLPEVDHRNLGSSWIRQEPVPLWIGNGNERSHTGYCAPRACRQLGKSTTDENAA